MNSTPREKQGGFYISPAFLMTITERPEGARRATGKVGNLPDLARAVNPFTEKIFRAEPYNYSEMARKPRRRRMGRYIRGAINHKLNLGTLAAATVIGSNLAEVVNERTLVSSIVTSVSVNDWTEGLNIGPIRVGVAHSDYSDAEIEAWIEATDSWDEGDKVAQEVAGRKIRDIGTMVSSFSGGSGSESYLQDGKPIKSKLNWILLQGQTIKFWAFNMGSAAFATTDPDVNFQGHANLWPR